jgi:hypothetical protein
LRRADKTEEELLQLRTLVEKSDSFMVEFRSTVEKFIEKKKNGYRINFGAQRGARLLKAG